MAKGAKKDAAKGKAADQEAVKKEPANDVAGTEASEESPPSPSSPSVATTTTVVLRAPGEEVETEMLEEQVVSEQVISEEVVTEEVIEEEVGAIKTEEVTEEEDATVQGGQQIYIIQTTDGSIPMETAEVVVADDVAVYETVSALEQLSRGNVVTAAGESGKLIQV